MRKWIKVNRFKLKKNFNDKSIVINFDKEKKIKKFCAWLSPILTLSL
jgi:hypothetical protein